MAFGTCLLLKKAQLIYIWYPVLVKPFNSTVKYVQYSLYQVKLIAI